MAAWFSFGAELLKVGDPAPDFSAWASDGTTVHLKDFLGQGPIVLYFYPKDDTPGCTKEACSLRDTFAEFKGLSATVFGVSFDSVASHQKFAAKYQLPFLLLADTDKQIAQAYGVAGRYSLWTARVTFVIDAQGKIARVFPQVSPATHSAELQRALADLPPPPTRAQPASPSSRPPGN